ncbi:MAG: hypothetical protein SCK70_10525 [bacterium]|nr:hypothetical protein [bacterium]
MSSLDIQIILFDVNFLKLSRQLHRLSQTTLYYQSAFPPVGKLLPKISKIT